MFYKIPYKSADVFFECPDGNITKWLSNVFPFFNEITTLDGIPSGYFESYSFPPCSNSVNYINY